MQSQIHVAVRFLQRISTKADVSYLIESWETERRSMRDYEFTLRSVPPFFTIPQPEADGYYTNENVITLQQAGEQYGLAWEEGVKIAILDARIQEVWKTSAVYAKDLR